MKFFTKVLLLAFSFLVFLGGAQEVKALENNFVVDVVWGTNTFIPADYEGKALPTKGSVLELIALTPTQNRANLEFSWSINDSSSWGGGANKVSIGNNTFTFQTEDVIPNFTHKIELEVRNIYNDLTSRVFIEVPTVSPSVILYEDERFVGEEVVSKPGEVKTIEAKPFYFNVSSLSELFFSWMFDGKRVSVDKNSNALNLNISSETATKIRKRLSLGVENRGNLGERGGASTSLYITKNR